jgi:3-oxoacyl-[acyl-carrier-protein] synthase II
MPQANRVAITGLALMTGLGLDIQSTWRGLLTGKSPIRRFALFDPEGLSSPFGVQLPAEADALFTEHIKPRSRKQMTRATMIAVLTAETAIKDARLDDPGVDKSRVGVAVGATGTGYAPQDNAIDEHRILKNMASASAGWISLRNKLRGPSMVLSTACASGAYALQTAVSLILSGQCDIVVSGAADSALSFLDVQGFTSLLALADDKQNIERASRPFDRTRSGFVMGEGGGMLVVESLESARKRRAPVLAEMYLPGLNSEAYNMLSPEPDGLGMAEAMRIALRNAGLSPDQIDYINAHGTSTQLNDLYETQAIKAVFGHHAKHVPISSSKSMTGHCLSGAAGVEAVICCKALAEGVIPPTANLTDPDPQLDLDYVPLTPRNKELRHVMSNSFAFGGHNGVCIFSKPQG